ncbi:YbhB/YbcL family Raf kinase inhibitor-like protein [Nocardia sp. NPDC059229]|uniref:YbhB/YbcL family Raf kinase inhibitor-like protein n=1 Tax=Nocardia sp. NPDC059229 TaxID=3346778 RepID=UPI0036A74B9B
MAIRLIGRLLRPVRAGIDRTAWFDPAVQHAPETLTVGSAAFADGGDIPRLHAGTGVGDNVSPPLHWSGVPVEAVELVLIVEDPDAPLRRPVVHGVFTGIDPRITGVPEGVLGSNDGETSSSIRVGTGSFGRRGYAGPRPVPGHGPHRYVFQFLALDQPSGLTDGATLPTVLAAVAGHVIARGKLTGRYERP